MKTFEQLQSELKKELQKRVDADDWHAVRAISERLEDATKNKAILALSLRQAR